MDKRTVEISLQTAREWYKSDNKALKEVALQAFSKEELTKEFYQDIKDFNDALYYLKSNNLCENLVKEYLSTRRGTYADTICKYRIVVAALTNNEERKLITGDCWFPVVQFCEIGKEKHCSGNKKIGTIEHNGKKYIVIGGCTGYYGDNGIGRFVPTCGISASWSRTSFLSVSSKKIAQYISEQFGRLLFEVHYGGVNCDWKWID